MHETKWREKATEWMKQRWPDDIFIEEAYVPYGAGSIHDKYARPDILRISEDGDISVVELKKWGSPEFSKWAILGQIQFYTFLIETQHKQDSDHHWMSNLRKKGLESCAALEAIERKIEGKEELVIDWCVVIVGGEKCEIEQSETLWHMHDYVNFWLDDNQWFRPMFLIHLNEDEGGFSCSNLECWFREGELEEET